MLTTKSQEIIAKYANVTVQPEEVTKKANKALANYDDTDAINLKLVYGPSFQQPAAYNAIAIRDLVND